MQGRNKRKKYEKNRSFFSMLRRFPLYKIKKVHYNVHIKYTFFTFGQTRGGESFDSPTNGALLPG